MRVLFVAFVAYALTAIAAPVSLQGASVAVATNSIAPSVSSVIIPTASLSAVAPVPSNSSVSAPGNAGGDEDEDENGEDQQDGDEDEQDENEQDENENEDEPDEEEEDEDETEGDEDEEDSDDDSHSSGTHEKFRVEIEIDTKHSDVVLSSILQPADAHLDVKVELDAAKVGNLLSVLLGDLNRVLDDAANLVEVEGKVGVSGGGTGVVNGSPQNGTLTTQASRRSSRDLASRSEGKITVRAKTRLQEKH